MMFEFAKNSIRSRFFTAIALVLLAGTFVLSVTIAINGGITQNRLLMKKGHGLAEYVAKISQDPLIMNDSIQLDSIVNEARYDDDILYTIILEKSGEIKTSQFASLNYNSPRIAHLKEKLRGFTEIAPLLEFIRNNESSVEVTAPIVTGKETIGRVVVCLSRHKIASNILNTVAVIIVLNIAFALILAVMLFVVSRRIIFDPISELARASRQLARGNLSTRITTSSIGEMQQLVESFNQMAEDLQQTTVSRDYVDNIIKSMTEALLIVSRDLIVLDVNDAAYRLLGHEQGQLTGIRAGKIFDETLLSELSSGEGCRQRLSRESWCTRKDGRKVPIYFTASAMLDTEGTLQGFVCTALDISAMKQVTEQLAATNRELKLEVEQRKQAQEEATWLNADLEHQKSALEAANLELESFCYSVSHDLRAPLRHINGFTTMLSEDYRECLDDLGRNCLDRICNASSHMGTLIDDLLSFSRVSRSEMKIIDVDLTHCAQKIAAMFQESEPDRIVRIEIEEGLTAKGDASLLDMVLQNLIGNAWKYSSGNPDAVISIGRIQETGNDPFFVKDNGVGFNMAYRDKLFHVFERLHGEEFEGTGIGLATVKRIIERHGGAVWGDGEVGKGATFYFTLPG